MDVLWSPWRYQYVSAGPKTDECVFCSIARDPAKDRENFVLGRGKTCFVVLNRFPYTTAHLLIVPYVHVPDLTGLGDEALLEAMRLARHSEAILREIYRPGGLNIGLNLGQCAGAGVAQHIHLHVLPRWPGDANFMTTVGETRVMPESLEQTWAKLSPYFADLSS